jgi:ferritin-like metal-binding protein YciE
VRGPLRDAAIVATAQRADYYEMAAYGTAAGWAEAL